MDTYWQQLIGLIVAPTLIVGAVVWVLRTIISQGFAKDIKRFESELNQRNFEHQQRFSTIHQRQAEVIANLYGKIAKSRSAIEDLVGIFQQGGQSLIMKKKRTADIFNDMSAYFLENQLFLPRDIVDKAESLIMSLRNTFLEFDTAQMGNDEYKPDQSGFWKQAHKRVKDEVPPILEELEIEFKKVLGIIEQDS